MNHRTLTIGLAIIGIANGLALGGVAYNRMGEPESLLSLTERELRMTGDSRRSENSGVTGRIEWCVRDSVETFREIDEIGFELAGCYARTASWLNATRLEELGFDLSVAPDAPDGEPGSFAAHDEPGASPGERNVVAP